MKRTSRPGDSILNKHDADKRDLFAIADLANEFGISTRAIRFYETKGLLKPDRLGSTRGTAPG